MQEDVFSLPWRERVRVRGQKTRAPSPLSSPVEGEDVSELTAGDKSISFRLASPPRGARFCVIVNIKECRIRISFENAISHQHDREFCGADKGSVKQNVLPRLGSDSTQIFPPCNSTSALEIARPRPVPLEFSPFTSAIR